MSLSDTKRCHNANPYKKSLKMVSRSESKKRCSENIAAFYPSDRVV